jgi:hypothetical protein
MPTCNECGRFVTQHFARVMGDNNDEVWGCVNCSSKDLGERAGGVEVDI